MASPGAAQDTPDPRRPAPASRTWIIYALALCALNWIYFGGQGEYPFDGDDDTYLRDSAEVSKDFANLLHPSRYPGRPLVSLVFWAGYSLWGESPEAFRLLVANLHLITSLLLAVLVAALKAPLPVALLSGLLFLINVAHFRAVQWISAMAYPLMFSLGIAALVCCLRYVDSRQPRWLAATYAAMLLAMLAHPAAVALWGFGVYLCWSREGRFQGTALRLLPLGGLLLATIAGMVYLYPTAPPVAAAARLPHPFELGQNFLWLLSRLFTAAYWIAWPIYRYATWELGVGLAALLGLALLSWRAQPLLQAWGVWTLLALLPFVTPPPALLSDLFQGGPSRFLYLASAGTAVLAAWALLQAAGWLQRQVGTTWATISLAFCLGALTASSFAALRSTAAFCLYSAGRNAIATGSEQGVALLQRAVATGDSLIVPLEDAHVRLCIHLLGTAEAAPSLAAALRQFPDNTTLNIFNQVALSLGPDAEGRRQADLKLQQLRALGDPPQQQTTAQVMAQAYGILALNLGKRGDLATAVDGYRRALELDPADPVTCANLGTTLRQLGRFQESIQAYQQAIQYQPNAPILHHNLGSVAQAQGDRALGISAFREAARLGSDNIETYLGLSQLYQENGQLDEALQVYSQILGMDLKGGSSELYNKMGTDLFRLGKLDASTNAYRKALAKDSTNLVAHVNLGWNCYLQGAVQEAISHYRQALAIQPTSQAQFNLGLAYLRLGQLDLARQTYAEGVAKYGAAEGRQVGAVDDLKQLIAQGIQVAEAQRLLDTYWQ